MQTFASAFVIFLEDFIVDLSHSIWDGMVWLSDIFGSILAFFWGIIQLVGYMFKFVFGTMWSILNHLFSLTFWVDLSSVFRDLTAFLGISTSRFVLMFFFVFVLSIFYFIIRMLTFKIDFKKKAGK